MARWRRRCSVGVVALAALAAYVGWARGEPEWAGAPAEMFAQEQARAEIKDGPMLGTATERVVRRADGGLTIVRRRTYDRVKHPQTGKVVALPQTWEAVGELQVSPSLRLQRAQTTARFHRSVDEVLGKDVLSDAFPELFEIDRTTLTAVSGGHELEYRAYLGTRQVEHERYDYGPSAVPLEIVGLHVAHQVKAQARSFEFELLLADGASHGVRADVQRVRDLRTQAHGYGIAASRVQLSQAATLVDLRLSSLLKRLFFPHHFYMVFSTDEPSHLLMFWGGDPALPLQALRVP